jgi:hypothetical protein
MIKFLRAHIWIILIFFGCKPDLYSVEKLVNEKPYTLSICATFKDEASYLKEWIEFHLLVGVDHFFLYNLGSTDDYLKILRPYIKKNIVTLTEWYDWHQSREENAYEWALGVQIPAYENALKRSAYKKTKWMVFLDVREFLASPIENKITDLLKEYEDCPGILLESDCYDASRNKYLLPPRKLLIQTIELTKPLLQNPQKEVTKCIFKPEYCRGFTWPPYQCRFKNLQVAKIVKKSELHINHYLNREGSPHIYSKRERLVIDHFSMTDEEMKHIFSLDCQVEDPNPEMHRFIPELAQKLGYNLEWGY